MKRRAVAETAQRLGVKAGNEAVALVLKTFHTTHGGKMSVARLLAGQVGDGTTLTTPAGEAGRVSGVFKLMGQHFEKRGQATAGETVAFGKLDNAKTGETLSSGKQPAAALVQVKPYAPVLAIAVQAKERKDDVKLGPAFTKLTEEDPSLTVVHNAESHEVVIWGQGEMHLRVAAERLADRFMVPVSTRPPSVGYRETIRKPISSEADTRSNRAVMANSVTWCWRSSRFRADPVSSSRTASPAAWCRAITFRRWRRASSMRSNTGRSAFPVVDMSRCADRRLLPHGGFLGSGIPHRRAHRHCGRFAAMPAGAARADPSGRDRLSE